MLFLPLSLSSQTASTKFLGAITAVQGDILTVKTDAGETRQVKVPSTAVIKRVAPGEKDLSAAVAIPFSSLIAGDRVLVKLDAASTDNPPQAVQIVAIKQEDVAKQQQKERDDWQQRGVGGLVKSVDAAAGSIQISSSSAKIITVHIAKTTVLRRYAQDSIRFDQAKVAPLADIKVGDQLRARGEKNADGSEIAAEEVVSGTFDNLSGVISALNPANNTLQIKDLATKKQVTIHIGADTQIRKLPEAMANALAARLKSASSGGQQAGAQGGASQRSGDTQQMLSRLPASQFTDLKSGEAIMVVSNADGGDVNALTLLAGVEPLLEAPEVKNLLANWSLGSGGDSSSSAQ